MAPTYDFTGTATTVLGFIGIVSTFVILVSCYRAYIRSPLNR